MKYITILFLLIASIWGYFWYTTPTYIYENDVDNRASIVENRLQNIQNQSQLIFSRSTVKVICGSKDESIWNNLGNKEILYKLTGYVTAGINTQDINLSNIHQSDSVIVLKIPHCKILSVNIPDNEIVCDYENVSGVSFAFTPEEKNNVKIEGENALYKSLENNRICEEGDLQAMLFFKSLLSQSGFNLNNCIIEFL